MRHLFLTLFISLFLYGVDATQDVEIETPYVFQIEDGGTCNMQSYRENILETIKQNTPKTIPPELVLAMIYVETGRDLLPNKIRFEKKLFEKFAHLPENRMRASSLGLMQVVYGFHKSNCNLSKHTDLFDPRTNIQCGTKILQDCLKRKNGNVRDALICYNGGSAYPKKVFTQISKVERQYFWFS